MIHDTFSETDRNPQAIDYRASLGVEADRDVNAARAATQKKPSKPSGKEY